MDIYEKINAAHQTKNYNELCTLYDRIKDNIDNNSLQEFDFVFLKNGLYKKQRYEDCLLLYKVFRRKYPSSDKLNITMGWCVYHFYLKNFDFNKQDSAGFFTKVDYVLNKVEQDEYSPIWRIVDLATKAIMEGKAGNSPNYALAIRYLEKVDITKLSHDEGRFTDETGHSRFLASSYETWFSRKIKCLLNLKKYAECISSCDTALATITKFHNNNDNWFKYKKAICLLKTGSMAESESVAKEIIANNFRHWCIYQLLYDISVAEGNVDNTLKYAGRCALADRSHEMRISFYANYAAFLDKHGKSDEAMLHRHLVIIIKQEKGWMLRQENQWEISEKIAALSKKDTLRRLKTFWEECSDIGLVYIKGKIDKMLHSGRDGFIKSEEGQSYYFNFHDTLCRRDALTVGISVRFTLEKRMNHRRNRLEENAVNIKLD